MRSETISTKSEGLLLNLSNHYLYGRGKNPTLEEIQLQKNEIPMTVVLKQRMW